MKTKFFKKALSVFTAMAMALSLMTGVPFSEIDLGIIASAAEPTSGSCGTNATWSLDDNGTLTISGTGAMANYSPSSPAPWNTYASDITAVVIESGVTSIGGSAFDNCASLTSITIPESVTSIGVYAFVDCISLESITIPKGVTSIDEGVFFNCKKLTTVTIPDSVTSIGNSAFYDCLSLTSIAIPEGVTSIGDYAFFCCTSLTSIAILEGVTSIGDYAFDNCTSLESITIPESVISIGEYAFCKCSGLTSITIPESVTSIGVYAFVDCTSLESITIPKGVTSIDEGVFLNCKKLTTVTIPDSVTSISAGAFIYCTNLTSIKIPASVTSIGEGAFYGCTSLASVTIPDSVTSIGESAFDECTSLKTANVPCSWQTTPLYTFGETVKLNYTHSFENGTCSVCGAVGNGSCGDNGNIVTWSLDGGTLTIIGVGAMENYSSSSSAPWNTYASDITAVIIESGVTSIGDYAFFCCDSLASVTIPASVTSIGEGAFDEYPSLKTVNAPCSWDGSLYTFNSGVAVNIAPHTNTYSTSGAVITVTCSECIATTGTLTISAAGGEYSGSAYTASVSGMGTLENEAPTITYCCDGGCINAGNHTATITMGGATATVEFTITRKPVTVTANNASKTYGEPDPTFTYTVTGLVNGDALTGKLTRESGENVGTYAITQGTLTNENNPNYAITFTNGTLTVSEKSSDGGSTPGEPDTPMRPADKVPFIRDDYGNSGWDAISTKIDEAKGGDTVIVDMNRATVVPGDIFEELKDKNVTMIIDISDGITWSVNGKDITSDNLKDIDFAVKQNTKNIPDDVVNNIAGERQSIQISLAHNGEIGFTAVLSINLGSDNAGQKAALYYYNGSSLELMCESEISADGTAQLTFTHASDYVIVIGESKSDNNSGGTSSGDSDSSEDNSSDGAPSGDDNSDTTDSSDESKGDTDGNPSTGVAVSLMLLAAATAFLTVSIKRKKKK